MDSQWLQKQFEINPKQSKAGLARALGLEPSAISKILKDTRQIKAHEYHGMRQYFGLPVDGERSLEPYPTSITHNAQLNDSDATIQADWAAPPNMADEPLSLPERVKAYPVQKDTGSVRFRMGEILLLNPDYPLSATPEPFVICVGSDDIMAMCNLDDEGMIHVHPFGGRTLSTRHKKADVQILGHIFSKMEMV